MPHGSVHKPVLSSFRPVPNIKVERDTCAGPEDVDTLSIFQVQRSKISHSVFAFPGYWSQQPAPLGCVNPLCIGTRHLRCVCSNLRRRRSTITCERASFCVISQEVSSETVITCCCQNIYLERGWNIRKTCGRDNRCVCVCLCVSPDHNQSRCVCALTGGNNSNFLLLLLPPPPVTSSSSSSSSSSCCCCTENLLMHLFWKKLPFYWFCWLLSQKKKKRNLRKNWLLAQASTMEARSCLFSGAHITI